MLTLEEANSLVVALGVAIPADYLKQKELEARFTKRCAEITAEFPDFKSHHSGPRAEELLNTTGMLAGREKKYEEALGVLDTLETVLRSPVPIPTPALPTEQEEAENDAREDERLNSISKGKRLVSDKEGAAEDWEFLEAAVHGMQNLLKDVLALFDSKSPTRAALEKENIRLVSAVRSRSDKAYIIAEEIKAHKAALQKTLREGPPAEPQIQPAAAPVIADNEDEDKHLNTISKGKRDKTDKEAAAQEWDFLLAAMIALQTRLKEGMAAINPQSAAATALQKENARLLAAVNSRSGGTDITAEAIKAHKAALTKLLREGPPADAPKPADVDAPVDEAAQFQKRLQPIMDRLKKMDEATQLNGWVDMAVGLAGEGQFVPANRQLDQVEEVLGRNGLGGNAADQKPPLISPLATGEQPLIGNPSDQIRQARARGAGLQELVRAQYNRLVQLQGVYCDGQESAKDAKPDKLDGIKAGMAKTLDEIVAALKNQNDAVDQLSKLKTQIQTIPVSDDPAMSAVSKLHETANSELTDRLRKAQAIHQQCLGMKQKIDEAIASKADFMVGKGGIGEYTPDVLEVPSIFKDLCGRIANTQKRFEAARGELVGLIGEAKELSALAGSGKLTRDADLKELSDLEAASPGYGKKFGNWNADVIKDWKAINRQIIALNAQDQPDIKDLLRKGNQQYDAYSLAYGEADERSKDLSQLLQQIKQYRDPGFASKDAANAQLPKMTQGVEALHTKAEDPIRRLADYQSFAKAKRKEISQAKNLDLAGLDALLTSVNQTSEQAKAQAATLNRASVESNFMATLALRKIGKLKVDKKLLNAFNTKVAALNKTLAPAHVGYDQLEVELIELARSLEDKRESLLPAEDAGEALARKAGLQARYQRLSPQYKQALLSQSFSTGKLKSLNQAYLAHIQADTLGKAATTLAELEVMVGQALNAKANEEKQGSLQQAIHNSPNLGDKDSLFPAKGSAAWKADADRGLFKGGKGKEFSAVVKAWEAVEKKADEKNLSVLEKAARAYMADYDSRDDSEKDDTSKFKYNKCKEALQNIRRLRIEAAKGELPAPPWDAKQEASARALHAQTLLETGSGEENESHGASESFWINDDKNKKSMIFKPSDGEADASFGWKKGGGAPREVMLSAVNEQLKNSMGLDFGVSRTSLASVEHDSFKSDRNGGNTKRTGAVQEFIPADKALTDGVKAGDPAILSRIPPEETQKALLLDFTTLQMDRQADNFLVQKGENDNPRLVPIDAGNALPSRKAFEAMRRKFTNNAAFGMPGGNQPFSDEMQEKIAAMDEEKIVAGMKDANKTMAEVDPQTEGMIDDENIENSRRSIRFLKKAAAFKPPLTTKSIGELYGYYFHKVLDAKKGGVDKACDDALKEFAANQLIIQQIDLIPNATAAFQNQGWPPGQFGDLRQEEPARLLKILQDAQPNPVVVKQMNDMIKQLGGRAKLDFDPDVGTYDNRLSKLRAAVKARKLQELQADPKMAKAIKAEGIDFTVERKGGKRGNMIDGEKEKTMLWLEKFEAEGGDKALKKKIRKDVSKMDFFQKVFESLRGEAKLREMQELGLNPYMNGTIIDLIDELKYMEEFESMGGMEAYVRLGGAQNAELSMFSRLDIMRSLKRLEKID